MEGDVPMTEESRSAGDAAEEREREDHDQRFKEMLREFIAKFFELFFPHWAARFDFTQIEWLMQEVFTDPPTGTRLILDLVAKLPVREEIQLGPTEPRVQMALIHIEVEAPDSVARLRKRVKQYYDQLRRDHDLPVLPIGLYLNVALDGIGWDVYTETFWGEDIVTFRYPYIGLPGLDAETYVQGENLLGVALSVLMKVAEEKRVKLVAEALRRIAESDETDHHRYILAECVQAYSGLDPARWEELQRELTTNPRYERAMTITKTYFDRGREEGQLRERRALLTGFLEKRLGPLTPDVRDKIERLTFDELGSVWDQALDGKSLKELGLEE
jgi:hypothetical protein